MTRALRAGALPAAIALALLLAGLVGSTSMGVERMLAALAGAGSAGDGIVLWEIRLPRALAALATGLALGASGAALQGLLRNPLAEPGVLGVSATAALSATSVIFFGLVGWSRFALPLAAIGGALAATALLTAAAMRIGSVVTLILVGVGLSSFAGALVSLLMNLAPHPFSLSDMLDWMLGTVANRSLDDLALTVPFMSALPSPGILRRWRLPPEGDGLRVDHGLREGDRVTPHHDPLLAKVVAHGADRATAIGSS